MSIGARRASVSRRLVYDENGQIQFPLNDLIKLEEQLNQTRWVVPVLPDGELIKCLRAAVRLATLSMSSSTSATNHVILFAPCRSGHEK